jgi:hypothetical protein
MEIIAELILGFIVKNFTSALEILVCAVAPLREKFF